MNRIEMYEQIKEAYKDADDKYKRGEITREQWEGITLEFMRHQDAYIKELEDKEYQLRKQLNLFN